VVGSLEEVDWDKYSQMVPAISTPHAHGP